ncbi:unnamed protein product, partial [Medioppia subpectinata]
ALRDASTGYTHRDITLMKLILCNGLHPQLAIGDDHNSYNPNADQMFHTKDKPFVTLHPNGVFASEPDLLRLSHGSDEDRLNADFVGSGRVSRGHQLIAYVSLLETTKPYLCNCLRIPSAHVLLLVSNAIDTNYDFSRIVSDGWLELQFPNCERSQQFILQALQVRDLWLQLLHKLFSVVNKSLNAMKMLTARQKSLSLSGGHIVSEQLVLMPSYSPNAAQTTAPNGGQHFPWDEDVNDINTPDIDPSFFDGVDPFKKMKSAGMDPFTVVDEGYFGAQPQTPVGSQMCLIGAEEDSESTVQSVTNTQSYEDMNLCQLLSQTNVDINGLIRESENESVVVAPNDVLDNSQYIPVSTTAPVLHYLQPKSVESSIPMHVITSTHAINHFSSPTHSSSQSYSPALSTINHAYLRPTPSPSALSYTSTLSASSPSTLVSLDDAMDDAMDAITSDSSHHTIDGVFVDAIDMKPDLDFLQPTVINDHLYTLPSTSGATKRRKSGEHKDQSLRKKNNTASKKSRVTKRDKQKMMEEQIQHYKTDNEECKRHIEQMEREIEWCKNYLFKKVVASARN